MDNMMIIEHNQQRVLTTQQLAEAYETDGKHISDNYINNLNRYSEGKHFFFLSGEGLRSFKETYPNISDNLKYAPTLYLWTEKGAWLHAKSLNNDRAWEAYETLVDDYYSIKAMAPQTFSQLDILRGMIDQLELTQKMAAEAKALAAGAQKTISDIKETLAPVDKDWRKWVMEQLNRVAFVRGGQYKEIREDAYALLEKRAACNLSRRVSNLKERLREQGATKTAMDKINRMDAIERDQRLKEIYTAIVRELAVKYTA